MTDLINDKVPPKSQGEQEKPGEWQEGETTGEAPAPQQADTQGAPGDAPALGQQAAGEGEIPALDVQQRWLQGMQALGNLAEQSKNDPFDQVEIGAALGRLKTQHGFTELTPTRSGEDWSVYARMNPDNKKGPLVVEGEAVQAPNGAAAPDWIPATATDVQKQRIRDLLSRMQSLGATRGQQVDISFVKNQIRGSRNLDTTLDNIEGAILRGESQTSAFEQAASIPGARREPTPGEVASAQAAAVTATEVEAAQTGERMAQIRQGIPKGWQTLAVSERGEEETMTATRGRLNPQQSCGYFILHA